MSSILRALKRIEKEAPPPDESNPWPRPIDSKKAVKSKVKKRWLMNKLVSGLVIFVVILVAGWLAYSQRHWIFDALLAETSSQEKQQASTASRKKKSVHQEKIKPAAKNVNKPAQRYAPATGKQSGKTVAQKGSTSSGSLKSGPGTPVQKSVTRPQTIKKPKPARKKIPLKNTTKRTQPVQPSVSRHTPASAPTKQRSTGTTAPERDAGRQDTRFESLRPIKDSKLKLQAIAWSEDTSRRMAVINNHIVREGGTVDGYSITNIRRDDVIVNDGSTSWRLEFSLKK